MLLLGPELYSAAFFKYLRWAVDPAGTTDSKPFTTALQELRLDAKRANGRKNILLASLTHQGAFSPAGPVRLNRGS